MSTPPQERPYEVLMERVRHDRAPNHELLDQTEASIWSGDQVIEYVNVLIDKVENDHLLARIDRMLALAATRPDCHRRTGSACVAKGQGTGSPY